MITYVDTSTLIKRLLDEDGSAAADAVWGSADVLAAARLVIVEARAALAAATRGRRLSPAQHRQAKAQLEDLIDELTLVEVSEELIAHAADLAEQQALRGYDAVHLAAALLVEADLLTSADEDLCAAAGRCGLHVANPLDS